MKEDTQEQIELIRQACIKANESILDLVFGCEVIMPRPWLETLEMKAIFLEETKNGAYQFFLPTHADTLTVDLHVIDGLICDDGWEIIGRPILLADVLLALKTQRVRINLSGIDELYFEVLEESNVFTHEQSWKSAGVSWKLGSDITLQSPELIAFVAGLLHG